MDYLSIIKQPIEAELADFISLFNKSLSHEDGLLGSALEHICKRAGKRMRPMLILLMAKNFGQINYATQNAAVGLELLHTASLVHDDVVDESGERRGQASVNATYDNKVAVLVGDYLLSTSLLQAAQTSNIHVVEIISRLGGTLSEGEVYQLANIRKEHISEEAYFHIIYHKTAALFAACAELGAISAGGNADYVARAKRFGELVGLCFQIRDDIFDYYEDSKIGKPTGNDMLEGKLTLPVIYAIQHADNEHVTQLAARVKSGEASAAEIAELVDYTKSHGGIEYAERRMRELHNEALQLLDAWQNAEVRESLRGYIDFVVDRDL